jgi:hypothetical protein
MSFLVVALISSSARAMRRRAERVVELLKDFILGGNRDIAQDVALGLLFGDGDARILGDAFLAAAHHFLKFSSPTTCARVISISMTVAALLG